MNNLTRERQVSPFQPEEKEGKTKWEPVLLTKKNVEPFVRLAISLRLNEEGAGLFYKNLSDIDKKLVRKEIEEMFEEDEKNKQFFYFGVYNSEQKPVGYSELVVYSEKKGEENSFIQGKEGYLALCKVHPDYRGQGVACSLGNAEINFAREMNCKKLTALISPKNPQSLISGFNQGFIIEPYQKEVVKNGYFDLLRSVNFDFEKRFFSKDFQEINLSDLEEINKLLSDGYAGVDIKNVYSSKNGGEEDLEVTDVTDLDPSHWTLIMRKVESEPQFAE